LSRILPLPPCLSSPFLSLPYLHISFLSQSPQFSLSLLYRFIYALPVNLSSFHLFIHYFIVMLFHSFIDPFLLPSLAIFFSHSSRIGFFPSNIISSAYPLSSPKIWRYSILYLSEPILYS
jgi:hypothetical protein